MMKTTYFLTCTLLLSYSIVSAQSIERLPFEPFPNLTQGIIYSPTFSRSMDEVYFVQRAGEWGKSGGTSAIYYSTKTDGNWSTPEVAPFSGEYSDNAPHLSADGKTLYFSSSRGETSTDIWKVEKDGDNAWAKPIRLDDTINSAGREYSPRITANGDLYFASDRTGGLGQGDIYMARKTASGFERPINLGKDVNTLGGEWNLCISSDGNILIVEASGRAENKSPYGDLYISFKRGNRWTIPQNMEELNTPGSDLYAVFAEGDKYMYYASSNLLKSPTVNIYKVRIDKLIEKYRSSAKLD